MGRVVRRKTKLWWKEKSKKVWQMLQTSITITPNPFFFFFFFWGEKQFGTSLSVPRYDDALPCHVHLSVCLWIMDPHSGAAVKNTSHGNEVLPQDTTHRIQRPLCQVCAKIQQAIGPHEYLLTIVKRRILLLMLLLLAFSSRARIWGECSAMHSPLARFVFVFGCFF